MCAFGREKAWLGAALAAFGVGCGEGDGGREIRDKGDKEIKTDNAPVGKMKLLMRVGCSGREYVGEK